MDNLSDVYYLIQLIIGQILIFLREFIFREFTWFASQKEDLDDTNPKISNVTTQHVIVDFLILLTTCGLLFIFMILSTKSFKSKTLNCDITHSKILSAVFDEKSYFESSESVDLEFDDYLHSNSDSIISQQRNIKPKPKLVQNIPCPVTSRNNVSTHCRDPNYDLQYSPNMRKNRLPFQTTPEAWLIRHTRSGQIYGKYPMQDKVNTKNHNTILCSLRC